MTFGGKPMADCALDMRTTINFFAVGELQADTGVTGRKLAVDSYGPYARNGGGALSGKDHTKTDRIGALYARLIAGQIVRALPFSECTVELAWEIGRPTPAAIHVDFGKAKGFWGKVDELALAEDALAAVRSTFDRGQTLCAIAERLQIASRDVKFADLAGWGHFGEAPYPWEAGSFPGAKHRALGDFAPATARKFHALAKPRRKIPPAWMLAAERERERLLAAFHERRRIRQEREEGLRIRREREGAASPSR